MINELFENLSNSKFKVIISPLQNVKHIMGDFNELWLCMSKYGQEQETLVH